MAAIQYDSMQIKTNVDSDQVTKVDEIEIIANLYSFFADKQLYLTDLFTQRMMEWVTGCIKADVCPDVYAEWMHSKDDTDHYKDVVNDCHSQIHKLTLEAQEFKLTIGERDAWIERLGNELSQKQDIINDVAEERDDLAAGVLVYAEEADEHINEINKLKAQLWDLTKEELIREWGTGGV